VVVKSTGPEPRSEAAEAAQVTEEVGRGDDIKRELEEEEEFKEGDGASGSLQIRRAAWVDPYEGLLVPSDFPGEPKNYIQIKIKNKLEAPHKG
jgi:hypothetical protein